MADSQPRHPQARPHPTAYRVESLVGTFAVDLADDLARGARRVHADSCRDMAFFPGPTPVPVVGGERRNSSGGEESEEGSLLWGRGVEAPWDDGQASHPNPPLMSTDLHSARQTCSFALPVRLESVPPLLSLPHQPQQLPTQDLGAWEMEPPLEDAASGARRSAGRSTRTSSNSKANLKRGRAQLTDLDEGEGRGGLFVVGQGRRYDPLGESAVRQRGDQPGENRWAVVRREVAALEARKAKKEREGHKERNTPSRETSFGKIRLKLRVGSSRDVERGNLAADKRADVVVGEKQRTAVALERRKTVLGLRDAAGRG